MEINLNHKNQIDIMFDQLFLRGTSNASAEILKTLQETWLEDLAKIIEKNKKNWFYQSNRPLLDLVQISLFVYANLNNLPVTKKLELPEKNGKYKFIIASVDTNRVGKNDEKPHLIMLATEQKMHQDIEKSLKARYENINPNLQNLDQNFVNLLENFKIRVVGWGWINIDNDNKTLQANQSSWSFWTLSNEIVERFLLEKEKQGYKISIDMDHQGNFNE